MPQRAHPCGAAGGEQPALALGIFPSGSSPHWAVESGRKGGSDSPNQMSTSSAEAGPGLEPASSPSWQSVVHGDSLGWGKKISHSVCGGGREMSPGPAPGTPSERKPKAVQEQECLFPTNRGEVVKGELPMTKLPCGQLVGWSRHLHSSVYVMLD